MKVTAGLANGGYTWMRAGFTPDQYSAHHVVDDIRTKAELMKIDTTPIDEHLDAVKSDPKQAHRLWAVADSPLGKDLLVGSEWDGSLDWKDPVQRARLDAFVSGGRGKKQDGSPEDPAGEDADDDDFTMPADLDFSDPEVLERYERLRPRT